MSISHSCSLKRSVATVAAAVSLMAAAVPAQAGVIAIFDPAFGSGIPNLGFRGTMNLNVSSGCYANPTGVATYVNTGAGCSITAQSAQITFYNSTLNPTGNPQFGFTQTLNLNSSYFPSSTYVKGAYFDATDTFAGFDTTDSNPFAVSVTDPGNAGGSGNQTYPISYTGQMLLYFLSGRAPQPPVSVAGFGEVDATGVQTGLNGAAYLVDCTQPQRAAGTACTRSNSQNSNPATNLTFTTVPNAITVPEPGTVSLSLLGLGVLFATRRRKRGTAATRNVKR